MLNYIVGFGVPVALSFLIKKVGDGDIKVLRLKLVTMYGYSWTCILIGVLLCAIPFTIVQWLVLLVTFAFNEYILILNFVL